LPRGVRRERSGDFAVKAIARAKANRIQSYHKEAIGKMRGDSGTGGKVGGPLPTP